MSLNLDEIDITILKYLQKDGRAQRNTIAEIVHLSVPSVSERMRKLEERGLIEAYSAILDHKKFNFDITAFIFVERSEEHTSELQSRGHLVCRLLLEKKKRKYTQT